MARNHRLICRSWPRQARSFAYRRYPDGAPAKDLQRAPMGIERHLLCLRWGVPKQKSPTVRQLEMRHRKVSRPVVCRHRFRSARHFRATAATPSLGPQLALPLWRCELRLDGARGQILAYSILRHARQPRCGKAKAHQPVSRESSGGGLDSSDGSRAQPLHLARPKFKAWPRNRAGRLWAKRRIS